MQNTIKNMKRLLLIISAILGITTAQAQYLKEGDIVSMHVGYWEQTSWWPENVYEYRTTYMEASSSGIKAISYATDNCLWELDVDTVSANTYTYSFRDLTTGMYLKIKDQISQESALILADNPSAFYFTDKGSTTGVYMYGKLYFKTMTPWNSPIDLLVSQYADIYMVAGWNPSDIYIEKWEQKGAGKPTGHFNPSKIEFSYVGDQEGEDEKDDDPRTVKFTINATTDSYYQCVNRPDEARLCRTTGSVNANDINVTNVYWLSDSNKGKESKLDVNKYVAHADENRTLLTLSDATQKNDDGIYWEVIVSPEGASPMGLKDTLGTLQRWIDYADNVVVEYTYGGGETQTAEMRVVRKAYHQDNLPDLIFSITPMTYTFSKEREEKIFDVVAMHQHGSVIYNVDNQVIKTEYDNPNMPEKVDLSQVNLTFNLDTVKWLKATSFGDAQIKVTAKENEGSTKRSFTLIGSIAPKNHSDHPAVDFNIELHQRGVHGGIQFLSNKGQTGDNLKNGRQQVHTAEKVIYYHSGQNEVELRLPESGYSGYMRWYDYKTNADPYYNENPVDSTNWVRSPRAADGSAFAAINTPRDASEQSQTNEGVSYGLYAVNKAASTNKTNGAVLDEDNPYNQMPIIKGWNYTYNPSEEKTAADSAASGYHTMACDVSAYTDYRIVYNKTNQTRIDTIQEPTLSYRQIFYLRPAEEMADTLQARSDRGVYLEEYSYQAPAGKQVLLSTEYRYRKFRSHLSEMCYFYRGTNNTINRIDNTTPVVWKKNGNVISNPNYTAELDYLIVRSETQGVDTYTLTLPDGEGDGNSELLIAKFVVKFVDIEKQGPTKQTIITQHRINNEFNNLKEINFDSLKTHLPWEQASYGYVYTSGDLATQYKRGASQGAFPFYGEYMLTESVNKDWARASAHRGQALYVDGTMEPGLVASISADATICSGQTMYCSAWFCNPAPSGWSGEGNPIFRCNIQGREAGSEEWEDVGVYFVGELLKGSGWQQIVFPIESAHNYAETRVSIYNFATTNQGNDFMVDDITLFVSRLPIAAYQGKMACRSTGDSVTSAAAVLRLDYSNINTSSGEYMYYQIYNDIENKPVHLSGNEAYYHESHAAAEHENHTDHGSIHIPPVNFDPEYYNDTTKGDKLLIYQSVSRLLDEMAATKDWRHAKAYIKTTNNGATKWLLYVAHIVENTTNESLATTKLYESHKYSMRMAYTEDELEVPACNLQTPLHATQQTVFDLRNSSGATIKHDGEKDDATGILPVNSNGIYTLFLSNLSGNCANDLYTLTSKVENNLAIEGGGELKEVIAPICSDWLVGDSFDDPYTVGRPATNSPEKHLVDSLFKKKYGYTRGQVAAAIMYDMRRVPTADEPNPNHRVKDFSELQVSAFESYQNYEIIKHLCDSGWLQFYDTAAHFYLGSADTARYWCFPIAETARATVKITTEEGKEKDTTIIIKDCVEPKWLTITSNSSSYYLNIAPIEKKDMTNQQKTQLPTVKVVEGSTQITIPVTERGESTTVEGLSEEEITLELTDEALTFMDMKRSVPMASRPTTLKTGEEYTIRLTLNEGASVDGCLIGYVFFNLQVVPATMIWSPTIATFTGWGLNDNWKGWVDSNSNNQIDEGELVEGFVPTSEVNVIIPKLDNQLAYPYIVPDDDTEHQHTHYPMTVGFQAHHCKNIYFEAGARIHNQHLLEYEKAFVDMAIVQGGWRMVSAPLKSMYSGDMYIPHTGAHYADASARNLESDAPFTVVPFSGSRTEDAPFAFWASYYNQAVSTYYDNGEALPIESDAAEFIQSNSMKEKLLPGSGFLLWGAGPDNYSSDTLTVRLPKSESVYYSSGGNRHDVPRDGEGHKLAFSANHNTDNMQITLSNKIASKYFLFGNPTMAYINMHDFLHDNDDVLDHLFYRIENGAWDASVEHTMGDDRFLAPMTSVMLVATNDSNEITLTLKASHLTLNNQVSPFTEENPSITPTPLPKRAPVSATESELMTIYALTDDAIARTVLATNPVANDYYLKGEDALFLSTGIENKSYVTTPLNMYTVAEQVPMMADVRQGISEIPLAILAAEEYRTTHMQLAFFYSANWSRTCYFYDSKTGQKTRIMDGLFITVEMPLNHEQRYYIGGPDEYLGSSEDNQGPTTAVDNTSSSVLATLQAFSLAQGELTIGSNQLIREIRLYDLAGRLIVENPLPLLHTTTTMVAPSGICLVEAVLRDGTTLHTQALVK